MFELALRSNRGELSRQLQQAIGDHDATAFFKDGLSALQAYMLFVLHYLENYLTTAGADDGRGRGGGNIGTGAGLGAAAFFAAAEVAVNIAVAASGPQKLKSVRRHGWRSLKLQLPDTNFKKYCHIHMTSCT